MKGRASPHYGKIYPAVLALAKQGLSSREIRSRLRAEYPAKSVCTALTRARNAGLLATPAKKNPGLFVIRLSNRVGARIAERAEIECMTPSALAKIILERGSRLLDRMEIYS